MKPSQHLQILTEDEIAEFYEHPNFNSVDRSHYFSLPINVLKTLKINKLNDRNTSTKLYFILQYGYFRAKHQFFSINYDEVKIDALFILDHYMPNDLLPSKLPTRKTQHQSKEKILQLMGYTNDLEQIKPLILKKTEIFAKTTQNPFEIFNEIVKSLEDGKMVLPNYSGLQDIIGAALKNNEQTLIKMVKRHLTKKARLALQKLFQEDESFYHITELKFDAKNFQTKEMKKELAKLAMCKPIYDFAKHFLPKLDLSRRMIDYYADLVKVYSIDRLQNIPQELSYLYLVCYVDSRYKQLVNNLVQAFIYFVDKYHNEAKKQAKSESFMLPNQVEEYHAPIGKLINLYIDRKIMSFSGNKIQQLAFDIMPKECISKVSKSLLEGRQSRQKQEQKLIWEHHKNNYQVILINLRPLFLAIDFEGSDELKDVFRASKFLKSIFNEKKSLKNIPLKKVPISHIKPKALLNHFIETISLKNNKPKKVISSYKYEFNLYRNIRENLKKSRVYVNNSINYKSFEAEININPAWDKKSKKILKKINNKVLLTPIDEILDKLEKILEPLIESTNKRALNGENKHIKITHHRNGSIDWTIPYPKRNDEIDNKFYDQLEIKTISEIFDFVEQKCNFTKAFRHIKPRGSKAKKDYLGIKATVLASGTMQGTYLFSRCSNIKYKRLQTSENNYIRLETLRSAADIIVDHMVNLPIFDIYDLSGKKHGSADGTKKKTRRRVLRARYSPKYFGLDIGMVIMSMNLGHVPFVTKIIGANEHESHFIYPMLYSNNSMIDPDIISTDTAGANNMNDLLYYLIGKTHAPCYRSLPKKAKNICGFRSQSHYKELLIRPSNTVNKELIKNKWPEIVPILVSLLSHETSQENIIKTLSSHEYKSDIKDALWEINNILKSIHILKYIDDPNYRRDIRAALNRGEAYHQLINKIADVGGGDFRGMTELEIEIWNECTRLIALVIIYYNMHLLSKLYDIASAKNDIAALKYLKHISPIASQHLNIGGLYEFSETVSDVNIDSVVEILTKILDEAVNDLPS